MRTNSEISVTAGDKAELGRLIRQKIAFDDLPPMVLALLEAWKRERRSDEETFQTFTARLSTEELAGRCEEGDGGMMPTGNNGNHSFSHKGKGGISVP